MEEIAARLRAAGCVFAEDEARLLLAEQSGDELTGLVARRVAGEPLEHLLGWAELAGHRWSVGRGVFVPRRRSELMVAGAVAVLGRRVGSQPAVVLDLCCGSGAVGGAVVRAVQAGPPGAAGVSRRGVVLHAGDVDRTAVQHARANIGPLGGLVHHGDLFDPFPPGLRGTVDVLLCHAPYVPTEAIATMPAEARDHEPVVALDGGPDGLDVLRRVAAEAPGWLRPGGTLLFEVGTDQVAGALALVGAAGLSGRVVHDEDGAGGIVIVATASTGGVGPG
ncbi:putative protein N(5)-glutamine methyltransferase [Isoptericola halotolerans]|uniref:Release factor glutamine methyltransferase n=1 Tax=Isoptericola halotolerans TaxID=300560 RepID=A0ABX2A458_9MICO|nr:release factor glutamine methyltransferase [Isoptericola halotolerans]